LIQFIGGDIAQDFEKVLHIMQTIAPVLPTLPVVKPSSTTDRSVAESMSKRGTGVEIIIDSYKDLVSAFDMILSKERPGVRIQFSSSEQSALAHRFLLEIKKDLPTAITQLKEFLTTHGSQELLASVNEKFSPSDLQGFSLNKSQQLFATDPRGNPIPLLGGEPPSITEHGKALVNMLKQAAKIGDDSRVTVNFVLPRSSYRESIAAVREQLRELLNNAEQDLELPDKFRDILKIVSRNNFDRESLTYRDPKPFADFIAERHFRHKSDEQQPQAQSTKGSEKQIPGNTTRDYSEDLQTFVIVCTPSLDTTQLKGNSRVDESVIICNAAEVHEFSQPIYVTSSVQVETEVDSGSHIVDSSVAEDLRTISSVFAGVESEALGTVFTYDASLSPLLHTFPDTRSIQAKPEESLEPKEDIASNGRIGSDAITQKEPAAKKATPNPIKKEKLGEDESQKSRAKNEKASDVRPRQDRPRITRVDRIEDVITEEDLMKLKNLSNYDSQSVKERFSKNELMSSYLTFCLSEERVPGSSQEVNEKLGNTLADFCEKLETLSGIVEKIVEKRLKGALPKTFEDREKLLESFNSTTSDVMDCLARDSHLNMNQQTETWKAVERLRGIVHVLADEPSMLPWKVAPIGPHRGEVVQVHRSGDIIVKLDNDARTVIWRIAQASSQTKGNSSLPKLKKGDAVEVQVRFEPAIDEFSRDVVKKKFKYKNQPKWDDWEAESFKLIEKH
jgi:hypothetical protein